MPDSSNNSDSLVLAYLDLRKAIGWLGTLLPFVLLFGGLIIFKTGIQSSLSAYYHTGMGDVFVGTLWALGVFFYTYRGYTGGDDNDNDNLVANFAGVFAIGVALFPTDLGAPTTAVGIAHGVFAALFFVTLAYFSLCLFRKTDDRSRTDEEKKLKKWRNRVYTISGYTIIASIVLIGILGAIKILGLASEEVIQAVEALNPTFWLQSIAVIAFGIAWLVKGQALALLRDPPKKRPEAEAQSA